MPRIRTLKPEFWADEKLSLLDPLTRLVFLGLISMADDAGRLIDNVKLLDGLLFPNTDDTCREALDTLARLSRVTRFRSASGQALIQITHWQEHQRVDRPSRHCLPGPETAVITQDYGTPDDTSSDGRHSRDPRESIARPSRDSRAPTLDLGPRTMDHPPSGGASGDAPAGPAVSAVSPEPPASPPATDPPDPCDGPSGPPPVDPPPAAARAAGARAGGWPAAVADRWRSRVGGGVTEGRVGRDLSGVVDDLGLDRVLAAVDRYAEEPGRHAWSFFAQDVRRLAETEPPLIDAWGVLTEYGERVTRPPGVRAPGGRP